MDRTATNAKTEALVSLADIAREHGLDSRILRSAARRGELPVARIGARLYTSVSAARDYFTPRCQTATAGAGA